MTSDDYDSVKTVKTTIGFGKSAAAINALQGEPRREARPLRALVV
jgi:hypothetical protein